MLVDGRDGWPSDLVSLGTEGDLYHPGVPPRTRSRAALPAARPRPARPVRRTGSKCFSTPPNDSWTDGPCAPGVVLVGNAAGGNDPIATCTPAGTARRKVWSAASRSDPVLGGPRLVAQLGPENVPAESFSAQNVQRILAFAW